MRIVLDTNVLVRANAKALGPAHELIRAIIDGPSVLILLPFLISEVERVLFYPRVRSLWQLSDSGIREHLDLLKANAELIYPTQTERTVVVDPQDDAVIHTATAGRADVICTLDRHFYAEGVTSYCRQRGIRVLDDVALLDELRRQE